MWVSQNAMLDGQVSVHLLANCFLGNTSLHHFVAESEVIMLTKSLLEAFEYDSEANITTVAQNIKNIFMASQNERASLVQRARDYVQSYYSTIKSLMENKIKFLYPKLKGELIELIDLMNYILRNSGTLRFERIVVLFQQVTINVRKI